MTPVLTATSILDGVAIARLASATGPCVSIFLPPARPGSAQDSHAAFLRGALKEFPELLKSLEDLTTSRAGGSGLAIFSSPDATERFEAPLNRKEKVVVASHFHLTPLIAEASVPREFFVLDVNKKHLRLLHVLDGEIRSRPLPAGVPANLEEAGAESHHAEVSADRSFTSAGQAVHFGKPGEQEASSGDVRLHFFAVVDHALTPALRGLPLVLAGVTEELAVYRRSARYPALLNADIHGNTAFLSLDEVQSRAMMAVRSENLLAGERILQRIEEMTDRRRQLKGVREVFEAAALGRVHQLCVAEDAEALGPPWPLVKASFPGEEDLVNAAAVLTIRAGGSVFVVPAGRMELFGPVAAILRY